MRIVFHKFGFWISAKVALPRGAANVSLVCLSCGGISGDYPGVQ
jgi:hypothetical protein